jgi:hypothetical protein
MIKQTLTLLNDKPNIFDFPQATIDTFKVDESDREIFLSSLKIFWSKSKGHFTSKYVKYHIDTKLRFFDITRLPKYPLPAVYNLATRRGVINISALGRKSVSNISMKDLYAVVMYAHTCCVFSSGLEVPTNSRHFFSEFFSLIMLKIFAKKHGLTGSYLDLIPAFKFLCYTYVYQSFFGLSKNTAIKTASHEIHFDPKTLKVNFDEYNFEKIEDLLLILSNTHITAGLTMYRFLETMIRNFGTMNLPLFEDLMRFCSILSASSINGNSHFPPWLQMYSVKLYSKVNSVIDSVLNRAL